MYVCISIYLFCICMFESVEVTREQSAVDIHCRHMCIYVCKCVHTNIYVYIYVHIYVMYVYISFYIYE